MTAGRGIAHSEESAAGRPPVLHGLQLWIALPEAERHGEPRFAHHADLPVVRDGAANVTVAIGEYRGERSPSSLDAIASSLLAMYSAPAAGKKDGCSDCAVGATSQDTCGSRPPGTPAS